jgi:hypothetical protein
VGDLSCSRVTGKYIAAEDAALTTVDQKQQSGDNVAAALVPDRSYSLSSSMEPFELTTHRIDHGLLRTAGDDVKFKAAVLKHGTKNWTTAAEIVPSRTFQQCRNRWIRVLGSTGCVEAILRQYAPDL